MSSNCNFGWKKRIGQNVKKQTVAEFEQNASEDKVIDLKDGEIDWLELMPSKKLSLVSENDEGKCARLLAEGSTLAEEDRGWEAITKWDAALLLVTNNDIKRKIFDMKSQVLLSLNELGPALENAEHAVMLNKIHYESYQTLGRAHLGSGNIQQAIRCFSIAIHLNPSDEELWQEDLKHASLLLYRQNHPEEEEESDENMTEDDDDHEEEEYMDDNG